MSVEQDIRRVEQRIQQRLQRFVKNIVLAAYYTLVDRSPIDTGRFSSNWQLGVGDINRTTTDATTVPALSVPDIALGQTVYLTNSLPYAVRLEHGWSDQAPQGIVAITAAELRHGGLRGVQALPSAT